MDIPHEDEDDDDEESEAADQIASLPGSMGPPPTRSPYARQQSGGASSTTPNPRFAPISASGYFDAANQVSVSSRGLESRVYYTPPKYAGRNGTVIFCHHGAGYSGLSFACFAQEVKDLSAGNCGVMSLDARRHGRTTSQHADNEDLSIEVLIEDFVELVRALFPKPEDAPTFIMVGHSMGGSVVARATPKLQALNYAVGGVAVLDAVEGFALEALPHMQQLLNSRPDGFPSIERAIEWHVSTDTIRNPDSARVSIPGCVTALDPADTTEGPRKQKWVTPLRSTSSYWTSWFEGLSTSFLAVKAARLLVLAGAERLDKELMIGQMQGKFQLEVVPNVGHILHEDDPRKLAEIIVDFWRRNERVIPGVKKVGDS